MSLLANLDRSLKVVPPEGYSNYSLNVEGVAVQNSTAWIFRLIPKYDENSLSALVDVFTQCVDYWIRLQNEQKHQLRDVSVVEFSDHVKRICFVAQFILASKDPLAKFSSLQSKVCDALSRLLPEGTLLAFPQALQEVTPAIFTKQLDPATAWEMQETAPPPLTEEILALPAPRKDITELPACTEKISDLPALYEELTKEPETVTSWIKSWVLPKANPSKDALQVMSDEIVKKGHLVQYGIARKYLEQNMAFCRRPDLPLQKRREIVQEMVVCAGECSNRWGIQSELQYRKQIGKVITLQDQVLAWKSAFIEQTLFDFLQQRLTSEENKQNTHYLSGIYHKWGHRLGVSPLESVKADTNRIDKFNFTWDDIWMFLQERWSGSIVKSIGTQVEFNQCLAPMGQFLNQLVERKLPSVEGSDYVPRYYFNKQGLLNDRGVIRLLQETVISAAALQLKHSPLS